MSEPKDRTQRRHPNDPDVVAHQMKMAAVTMPRDERDALLATIDRQLRELDGTKRSAGPVAPGRKRARRGQGD